MSFSGLNDPCVIGLVRNTQQSFKHESRLSGIFVALFCMKNIQNYFSIVTDKRKFDNDGNVASQKADVLYFCEIHLLL